MTKSDIHDLPMPDFLGEDEDFNFRSLTDEEEHFCLVYEMARHCLPLHRFFGNPKEFPRLEPDAKREQEGAFLRSRTIKEDLTGVREEARELITLTGKNFPKAPWLKLNDEIKEEINKSLSSGSIVNCTDLITYLGKETLSSQHDDTASLFQEIQMQFESGGREYKPLLLGLDSKSSRNKLESEFKKVLDDLDWPDAKKLKLGNSANLLFGKIPMGCTAVRMIRDLGVFRERKLFPDSPRRRSQAFHSKHVVENSTNDSNKSMKHLLALGHEVFGRFWPDGRLEHE